MSPEVSFDSSKDMLNAEDKFAINDIINLWFHYLDSGDIDGIGSLCLNECVLEIPNRSLFALGVDEIKTLCNHIHHAVPSSALHFAWDIISGSGDDGTAFSISYWEVVDRDKTVYGKHFDVFGKNENNEWKLAKRSVIMVGSSNASVTLSDLVQLDNKMT